MFKILSVGLFNELAITNGEDKLERLYKEGYRIIDTRISEKENKIVYTLTIKG